MKGKDQVINCYSKCVTLKIHQSVFVHTNLLTKNVGHMSSCYDDQIKTLIVDIRK